jgi:uncharacterized protein (DUF362 family)
LSRNIPSPTVALIRCTDYGQAKIANAIATQFELLGGLQKFVRPGDSVLIKPNLIAPRSRRHAAQTDPAVIIETARLLKDFGAKPFVGDSPAWGNVFGCIKALELAEPLRKLAVPVRPLTKPKIYRIGRHNTKIGISSVALDADVIINLPKFKTHQQLVATFAVKNMFGTVAGKRKALWHFTKGKNSDDFCELLIAIFKFLAPALTIIDAVTVMDGPGPIRGRVRPLGFLIGGTEPIACETVCCELANIKPLDLPIIKTARQAAFGCSEPAEIKIIGDGFTENTCTDFELPRLIPIRFSLPHVCKSICKQILLLAKYVVKGKNPS